MADLIVSELLGSFGDNELSPECLDGIQRFLKGRFLCPAPYFHPSSRCFSYLLTIPPCLAPADGASIPCESTSYLAPVSTSHLWSQLHYKAVNSRSIDPLEQCYVVKLGRSHSIAPPQPCFRFQHPNIPGTRLEYPDVATASQDTPKAKSLHDMWTVPLEYEELEQEAKLAWASDEPSAPVGSGVKSSPTQPASVSTNS